MKAIILAGGRGTRLRPYTNVLPKPLMPVGDYPVLDIVIRQLKKYGFTDIVIAVGHLSHLIESYFGDGSKWDVNITYSKENKPLGTAGPISIIENLEDDFLLMNGDILTTLDFREMLAYHKSEGSMVTIAMYNKKVTIELGTLTCDDNSMIIDYLEKPTINYKVSTGLYIFTPSVKNYLEYNKYIDLPDLIKLLIKNAEKVKGFSFNGLWYDLGRKEDYEEINGNLSGKIYTLFLKRNKQ